jgi:hypothetical protein
MVEQASVFSFFRVGCSFLCTVIICKKAKYERNAGSFSLSPFLETNVYVKEGVWPADFSICLSHTCWELLHGTNLTIEQL